MLASVALVGCSSEDAPEVNNGKDNQKGDAYVTVKLSMSGNAGSRAAFSESGFKNADQNEVDVNKAIFYFFDANGQGCANKYVMDDVSNLDWTAGTSSIDQESNAIVVIKNPVATPASMIVLLNCDDPTTSIRPSLAELQAVTKTTGNLTVASGEASTNYHIMSNAVYVDNGTVMVGTPITEDNITTSADDKNLGDVDDDTADECTPVVVTVERLWAKVGMTPTEGFTEPLTTDDYTAAEGKTYEIQATVTGWWLASKANKTYLIKSLSNAYTAAPFIQTSTWWNDAANNRSYWANMPEGVGYTNATTWNGANEIEDPEYCLENTSNSVDGDINQNGPGTATQYAAKAVLKLKVGNDYVPTTFVRWLNTIYTEPDFFQMIANAYNNYRIQVGDALYDLNGVAIENEETAITGVLGWNYNGKNEDDTDTGLTGLKNYEGIITVTPADGQTLVKKVGTAEGGDIYETVTATAIQAEIRARIDKVLLWLDGQTYYYTDIIHNQETKEVSAPLYGIVRNHLYTLKVTGLTGMGTPVPNGDLPINPERPEGDEYSHISAEVQILSYKVVPTQNVELR